MPIHYLWWFPLLRFLTITALAWSSLSTDSLDSAAFPSSGYITNCSKRTKFEQAWATKTTPPDSRLLSWHFSVLSLLTRYRVPLHAKQSYSTALLFYDSITSILGRQLSGNWFHLRNLRIVIKFRKIYWQWLYIRNACALKTCVFGIASRNSWQMDHAIFFEICRYQCWEYFLYISIPIS